jgi:hypothetical protein
MRLLTALALITLTVVSSAPAQEPRSQAPSQQQQGQKGSEWQSVITRQIEAFRAADGASALSCAGEAFRTEFKDPSQFYEFIAKSPYAPIVESRSHSFGEFKMAEDESTVLQIVNFTGSDQRAYKAMYEMTREASGWKVQGVSRLITDSVAI